MFSLSTIFAALPGNVNDFGKKCWIMSFQEAGVKQGSCPTETRVGGLKQMSTLAHKIFKVTFNCVITAKIILLAKHRVISLGNPQVFYFLVYSQFTQKCIEAYCYAALYDILEQSIILSHGSVGWLDPRWFSLWSPMKLPSDIGVCSYQNARHPRWFERWPPNLCFTSSIQENVSKIHLSFKNLQLLIFRKVLLSRQTKDEKIETQRWWCLLAPNNMAMRKGRKS